MDLRFRVAQRPAMGDLVQHDANRLQDGRNLARRLRARQQNTAIWRHADPVAVADQCHSTIDAGLKPGLGRDDGARAGMDPGPFPDCRTACSAHRRKFSRCASPIGPGPPLGTDFGRTKGIQP